MTSRLEQIDAYLDGTLDSARCADLEAALIADSAVRDLFVTRSKLNSRLRNQYALDRSAYPVKPRPSVAVADVPKETYPIYRKGRAPKPIPFIIYPVAIAAAALLTAAIVVVYLLAFTTDPQPDPIKPNQPGPAVATLIENTGDLTTPHGYPAEGDDYGRGEYTLSTGTAEFMLTNAVNVKLRGETRMHMRNNMNVSLTRGSASFVVPTGAEGFTVELPGGTRVVDLGTSFRVAIEPDGRRSVRVIDGAVRIDTPFVSQILEAPLVAYIGEADEVETLDPAAPFADAFDAPKLAHGWVWDSPGQAEYAIDPDAGVLRLNVPSGHNLFHDNRGLAPVLYRDLPIDRDSPTTIECDVHLPGENSFVNAGIVVYNTAAPEYPVHLLLIRKPGGTFVQMQNSTTQARIVVEPGSDRVRLRLTHDGEGTWRGEYRAIDSETWMAVEAMEFELESTHRIGLLTKSWRDESAVAEYADFRINPKSR